METSVGGPYVILKSYMKPEWRLGVLPSGEIQLVTGTETRCVDQFFINLVVWYVINLINGHPVRGTVHPSF